MFIKRRLSQFLTDVSWLKFIFLFILIFINCLIIGQPQTKKSGAEKISPLIKTNLLPKKDFSSPFILRNIFSPQRDSASLDISSSERLFGGLGKIISNRQDEPKGEKESPAGYNLSLRYIGYIYSPGKTIALIIYNGLAMPVAEGEFISSEFQVVKITPAEIIIAGPNKKEIRFSLEGE